MLFEIGEPGVFPKRTGVQSDRVVGFARLDGPGEMRFEPPQLLVMGVLHAVEVTVVALHGLVGFFGYGLRPP